MMSSTDHTRFEELDAGRVLGDLSPEELREWEELQGEEGTTPEPELDLAAAAVAALYAGDRDEALPAGLADRLRQTIPRQPSAFGEEVSDKVARPAIPSWLVRGEVGWAAAILFAVLFLAGLLAPDPQDVEPVAAQRLQELKEADQGLLERGFKGVGDYEGMEGSVVWSDDRQEGYMTLTLPANDPARNQYQLWIVDPDRDEAPVDGGVFDIPAGRGRVVVPIDAKLAVDAPKAFVITLEQPGGVVKSKQEVVVALASL